MTLQNWPENERPREKLLKQGAQSLSDAELLAVFIRTGTGGKNAVDIARSLLKRFGDLNRLLNASKDEVLAENGIGPAKYVTLCAARELGRRYIRESITETKILNKPELTGQFLISHLRGNENEVFCCLFLDGRHQIITFEEMFQGTIDRAIVHPREIVKSCLRHNAAAVIFAHNHPSGLARPSQADREITNSLREILSIVDVEVLDHFIVSGPRYFSFAEHGYC